mgnify:CR=1 FL=1
MEILQGVERRRRWSEAEKLRIVAEAEAPGAVFAQVARRHDVSRGQLWTWRRLVRSGELGGTEIGRSGFIPVCLTPAVTPTLPVTLDGIAPKADANTTLLPQMVEIVFPDGVCLRIDAAISPAALRRVLGVLRG